MGYINTAVKMPSPGTSNSNTHFVLDNHSSIFYQLDRFVKNNSDKDDRIPVDFEIETQINVFSVIRDNLSNKNADELWNTTIVVLPGLWPNGGTGEDGMALIENGSRPIVLNNFTYDDESNSMFCDFNFFGESSYWYNGDGYTFKGTIKGLAKFSWESQPKRSSDDTFYNTCVLDVSYGILSYNYNYHQSE